MDERDIKTIQERFKLTCVKCGSENVVMSATDGHAYDSGYAAGTFTIGCNDCKDNDIEIST